MRRRAFTLVEMMIVVSLIMVVAALVLPNVVAMKAGREKDAAYAKLLLLAQQGREDAIRTGKTYSLTLTDNGSTMLLQQDEDTGSLDRNATSGGSSGTTTKGPSLPKIDRTNGKSGSGGSSSSADSSDGSDDSGGSATLPDGVTTGEITLGGKTSSISDFTLHFYPDGRSEGGGVEWVEGSTTRNLSVTTNGIASLTEGKLPDAAENRWEAGTYEQRATG